MVWAQNSRQNGRWGRRVCQRDRGREHTVASPDRHHLVVGVVCAELWHGQGIAMAGARTVRWFRATLPTPTTQGLMSEPTSRFSDVSSKKQRGVTYTPPALARLLAEKVVAAAPSGRACTALDPACGDGVLLAALAEAWSAQRSHALDIVGLDVDPSAVQQAQLTLSSSPFRHSVTMGDFLSEGGAPVDIVVANPPWVRTQVLGSAQARAVAAKFGLSGRIDLAQAFVLAIADRLCAGLSLIHI